MDKGTAGENETEIAGSSDCIEVRRIKREDYLLKMISVLEYGEEPRSDFDLGMLGGVKIDYETGVFRRYHVENNPVRAKIADKPEDYRWSSARAHVYNKADAVLSNSCYLTERINDWQEYLNEKEDSVITGTIFQNTKAGRPCGDETFVGTIEGIVGRRLAALSVGRPRKIK